MADLLRVLESVEQGTTDARLSSALRQLAHWHEEAESDAAAATEWVKPSPAEWVRPFPADRNANPIVERIAAAMRLAAKAG